ncbi:MAG: phytoene desaturase family protein [Myxococcota bacterium]|nr:phytoene desaturase family protein [Myxococcota bacterium]
MANSAPIVTRPAVIVVGGGIGGIVSALILAAKGCDIRLYERSDHIGGKMRSLRIANQDLDVGPTVLTMRWVFDHIFRDIGQHLDDHLELRRSPAIARHFWEDGSRLDLFSDPDRSFDAVEQFAGAKAAKGFRRFLQYAQSIFTHANRLFIMAKSPALREIAKASGRDGPTAVCKIDGLRSMARALKKYFDDERLHQLFARYATYYGSSPFRAPATLNLIAHVEQKGVWLPVGGMAGLANTLASLAQGLGAALTCNCPVDKIVIENNQVKGVVLEDSRFKPADAVIFNGDLAALAQGALGVEAKKAVPRVHRKNRSLSAFTLAGVTRTSGASLLPHNVFFHTQPYAREFEDIFKGHRLPEFPTVYVRAQDRDKHQAIKGQPERLFLIINAPPVGDHTSFGDEVIQPCIDAAFSLLDRCGLNIDRQNPTFQTATPRTFAERFPHTGGAIYGGATHSMWAPLRRPAAQTNVHGLFLAGGSVHPGAGVPMAGISGRLAANAVLQNLGLPPLPPLATSGHGAS